MASKSKAKLEAEAMSPPVEQMRGAAFAVETVHDRKPNGALCLKGVAYRRRPMIDILHEQGLFSQDELKALRHYRHHADLIDGSPTKDSLCIEYGGGGDGRTITMLNASYLVRSVESAVGTLVDILRAVVVDDTSLSQWAINRYGGIEKRRQRKGRVQVTIEPRDRGLAIARLEMKFAAQRVASELAA